MIETPRDVETDAQVVRKALSVWGSDVLDPVFTDYDGPNSYEAEAALDRILAELQQVQERATKTWWNKREHELEDELQQVKDERDGWREGAFVVSQENTALRAELQQVQDANERYREALRFYAEADYGPVDRDSGDIARAALEGTDPEHLHKFGEHGTCVCGETPPFGAALEGTDQ